MNSVTRTQVAETEGESTPWTGQKLTEVIRPRKWSCGSAAVKVKYRLGLQLSICAEDIVFPAQTGGSETLASAGLIFEPW